MVSSCTQKDARVGEACVTRMGGESEDPRRRCHDGVDQGVNESFVQNGRD